MTDQLFPHSNFGYRLEFKDNKDKKICWFCHPSHVTKYLDRYKIDPSICKIDVHPDYPPIDGLSPKKQTKKKSKPEVFADLDTYVKITDTSRKETKAKRPRKASPAPTRSASKAPKGKGKGDTAPEASRLLTDRFQAKKK